MKSLRICLGLCAVAMCLSAFAQRPPKGYNYAYGDFNGDGKKEYVYSFRPKMLTVGTSSTTWSRSTVC